jgi:hypothetical protein
MTRAQRIAGSLQVLGFLLIILWFVDSTPEKSYGGLVFGILCFIVAIPFVYIHNKYGRRY